MAQARQGPGQAAPPPDPDEGLLVGGPHGQPPPPDDPTGEPVTPSAKTVKLAGQDYAVDPDIAQAIEAREQEMQRKLTEHSQELGDLRRRDQERLAAEEAARKAAMPQQDISSRLFEQPEVVLNELEERIVTRMTGMYAQQTSQNDFWQSFYAQNPDLDRLTDHFIVQAVLNQHMPELQAASTKTGEAQAKLGELTRTQILRLSQKQSQSGDETTRPTGRAVVEGAGIRKPAPVKEPEDTTPKTFAEISKRRRDARRSAGKKKAG